MPLNPRRRSLLAALSAAAGGATALPAGSALAQLKLDVPFAPTNFTLIDTMLRVANVTPKDFVIDLGSGDGRINIAAARDWGAPGIGYEIDPALVRAPLNANGLLRACGDRPRSLPNSPPLTWAPPRMRRSTRC